MFLTKVRPRLSLGATGDVPVVGMIGRVTTWKGQDIFLRAAGLLRDRGVEFYSVTIGGVFDNERFHMERLLQLRKETEDGAPLSCA